MVLPGARQRLLVVDDHASVCALLARELGRTYHVDTSASATEALARIRGGTDYALVLCDVVMPGMSGMQFVDAIEQETPQLLPRIALMTGGVLSAPDAQRLAKACVQLVYKPFDRRYLMMVIDGLLARAS